MKLLKVTKNIDIVIHLADIVAGMLYLHESSVYRSYLINTNTLNLYLIKLKIFMLVQLHTQNQNN